MEGRESEVLSRRCLCFYTSDAHDDLVQALISAASGPGVLRMPKKLDMAGRATGVSTGRDWSDQRGFGRVACLAEATNLCGTEEHPHGKADGPMERSLQH